MDIRILTLAVFVFLLCVSTRTSEVWAQTVTPGSPTLPVDVPIVVLQYLPRDPASPHLLDGAETGWGSDASVSGRTLTWWEQRTDEMVTAMLPVANEASRYHGYKDSNAPEFFYFTVKDTKKYYTAIPRGVPLGMYQGIQNYRPNYGQILRDINICHYVDTLGVKEIWMYGYHNDRTVIPDESRMSSKYGDVSNAIPKEETIDPQYRMPRCTHSYVLYNFTYQPGGATAIANAVHNRIHQIENVIPFAEGPQRWPPIRENQPNTNIPGSIFWGDFSEYIQDYTQRNSYRSSCGNAHNTPNWANLSTDGYRYNITQPREFNCETWHPDETNTTYISAGCERWGCTDLGFYVWFMQNIPGYNNGITHNGQPMKNWWEAMYDFNAFIDNGRSLYGRSIFSSITPTPTITITPSPSPSPPTACNPNQLKTLNCFEQWRQEYRQIQQTTVTDFDGNGTVTLLDFEIWRRAYTATGAS